MKLIEIKLRDYAHVTIYDQSRNAFKDILNGTFYIGKYDYVLEIHFNAFNGNAYGTEIYTTTKEEDISVEKTIMKKLSKYFKLRDFDGVKQNDFLVIKTIKNQGISAALLETCFIDSKSDMDIYINNKEEIADCIVEGIVEGFGLDPLITTLKYKVGDIVRVSSYYVSSDAPITEAIIKNAVGTITRLLTNGARNPYLLDEGNIGWCNDGDIREKLN